jgi:hypothetical protein
VYHESQCLPYRQYYKQIPSLREVAACAECLQGGARAL